MDLTETEQEVIRVINSRWALGRSKYGEGMDVSQNPDPLNWVQEAIEECADQFQYLVALKLSLQKRLEEAENDYKGMRSFQSKFIASDQELRLYKKNCCVIIDV